jgi:hypothetical protein
MQKVSDYRWARSFSQPSYPASEKRLAEKVFMMDKYHPKLKKIKEPSCTNRKKKIIRREVNYKYCQDCGTQLKGFENKMGICVMCEPEGVKSPFWFLPEGIDKSDGVAYDLQTNHGISERERDTGAIPSNRNITFQQFLDSRIRV